LNGEQGSCKSTATKVLRALIDPNAANLRTAPRDERDLVITASNSWLVVLDNVSNLADWLSDALCRLATGGGLATRQLYTDTDEVILDVQRPVILNGIADLATRGDLMDRSVTIQLAEVPENKRRNEKEFWTSFEEVRPKILGAVLDTLSRVLARLPDIKLDRSPRMMDFAIMSVAAEQVLGWEAGSFLRAYSDNRSVANTAVLESSVVGMAVRAYVLDQNNDFVGSPRDLLDQLTRSADAKLTSERNWPKNPTAFGKQFRRLAPSLRQIGIEVSEDRSAHKRVIKLRKNVSHPSHPSSGLEINNFRVTRDDMPARNVSQGNPLETKADDTCDTCDGIFPTVEGRVD
jgi:hypothetical protein